MHNSFHLTSINIISATPRPEASPSTHPSASPPPRRQVLSNIPVNIPARPSRKERDLQRRHLFTE
jgi:hypothetical protein